MCFFGRCAWNVRCFLCVCFIAISLFYFSAIWLALRIYNAQFFHFPFSFQLCLQPSATNTLNTLYSAILLRVGLVVSRGCISFAININGQKFLLRLQCIEDFWIIFNAVWQLTMICIRQSRWHLVKLGLDPPWIDSSFWFSPRANGIIRQTNEAGDSFSNVSHEHRCIWDPGEPRCFSRLSLLLFANTMVLSKLK